MSFDPTLPVDNSLISSSELRNQFTGLNELIDNVQNQLLSSIEGTALNPSVSTLGRAFPIADSGAGARDSEQVERTHQRNHQASVVA